MPDETLMLGETLPAWPTPPEMVTCYTCSHSVLKTIAICVPVTHESPFGSSIKHRYFSPSCKPDYDRAVVSNWLEETRFYETAVQGRRVFGVWKSLAELEQEAEDNDTSRED